MKLPESLCFFCIYLPDGFVVFMVWACVDVLKVFFFLSFSSPVDVCEKGLGDQQKEEKTFSRMRGLGMNRSECKSAVSVPLYRYFSPFSILAALARFLA